MESAERRRQALPPPPLPPRLPPLFRPVEGQRRIIERRETIIEDGRSHHARIYEPPLLPAPWEVRAWHEPHSGAHVIDITAHPLVAEQHALSVKVYAGEEHVADREAFKKGKQPLWPDDKFVNRVVHRAPRTAKSLCFLIEVAAYELRLDFFHEPFSVDGLSLAEDESSRFEKSFARLDEIEELERAYAEAQERLRERSGLAEETRDLMENHLSRIYEQHIRELYGVED